jgi:hypothetical protein
MRIRKSVDIFWIVSISASKILLDEQRYRSVCVNPYFLTSAQRWAGPRDKITVWSHLHDLPSRKTNTHPANHFGVSLRLQQI